MTDIIYNEDCLIGMDRIADGSIDFVLTDLPFGTTDCPFDKRIDLEKFWTQIKRVTKHNAATALFAQMPFAVDLVNANRKMFRYEWIWQKCVPAGFLNCNKMPLRSHEQILLFYRALPTYNPQKFYGKPYKVKRSNLTAKQNCYNNHENRDAGNESGERYPIDIIKFDNQHNLWGRAKNNCHPTQKPVDLLEYLIKTYTNEGETVLDATIGSGSTAVACINTNRHFIGFETEEKFYEIANKRIAEAQAKKSQELF